MKRVCCYCERWESGGIESFLNNVLSRLDLQKVKVDIVAAELQESVFTKGLQEKGVQFRELSGSMRNLRRNWKMFRALLAEQNYDVVHIHAFQGLSMFYALLAKRYGVPVRIVHSHNTALRKSRTKHLKLALHHAAKGLLSFAATDRWACSTEAAQFMFSKQILRDGQFRFIPNGIKTEKFQFDPVCRERMRKDLGLENAFVIGNVGRLCYQKNQIFLLDVLYEVLKREPTGYLLLVGNGDTEGALKARAKELGISDRVMFYGVTNEVEKLFWAMDVFAFPSIFEGLGIVAVEAQASGLPVVCSEFVPSQACVSELFQSLELTKGASEWAQQLCKMKTAADRAQYAQVVADAGFHIDAVSKRIQEEYLR